MPKFSKQRAFERFELMAPATIRQPANTNGEHHHLLLTKDISCKGAYFSTMGAASYERYVQVELLLQITDSDHQVKYVYMTTTGEIIRRDQQGLAIQFDDDAILKPFYIN
ncbi:MAG TPA: PilZ domain-containing protein [Pelovirga sp.]|nr:PilZ domain-containing protein [Pelovirga sp.]